MNAVNKSIQWVHRWTGIIIALFFAMWFISGIILLYHSYPRVTTEDYYRHMESLQAETLPPLLDLPGLSDTTRVKTLSVSRDRGCNVWTISGISTRKDNPMEAKPVATDKFILADSTLIPLAPLTPKGIDSLACVWAASDAIIKVDTLTKRQQWIMYERYEKSLPVLKYSFNNLEKSEIFISQKSGEVIQASTRPERIWSYFGAIPHKFYFPFLRTDVEKWKTAILIGGLFCLVAALSGMYIGVYYLIKNRQKHHKFASPFKKKVWRYHHIVGLIFGIFLIAWGISGSLAMQRVPKWLVNYDGDYFVSASKLWGRKPLPLSKYQLDYRELLKAYPDVKSISWEHFGNHPAYLIVSGDKEIYIDASKEGTVATLNLSKEEIENAVERYFGDDVKYTISLQDDYDEYYLSRKGEYPLPVWRIDVEDSDGTRMYVSPSDGYVKYLNHNRMAKKWLFSATHYLGIKYFVLHQGLRYACLWILSAGCLFVIVTGVCIFFSKIKLTKEPKEQKKKDTKEGL